MYFANLDILLGIDIQLLLALESLKVPKLSQIGRKRNNHITGSRMHTEAHNRLLVALHPADELASLGVEALYSAVNTRYQILGLALEIIGQRRASYA